MTPPTLTERLLVHDRTIVLGAIVTIAGLAWWHIFTGAGTGMSTLAMSSWEFPNPLPAFVAPADWSVRYALIMLTMWWAMMVAMMLPSASPLILLYARVYRHGQTRGKLALSPVPVGAFTFGYLLCWLGFSVLATLLQFALEHGGLLDGMVMWSVSPWLSVALLAIAGVYQLTPLKQVCLVSCRSPAAWVSEHWRPGAWGALWMGLEHGAYCTGCCWAMMLLLFAGGAMNLVWIAGLSLLVLLEKVAPQGTRVSRLIGILLLGGAAYVALTAWPGA